MSSINDQKLSNVYEKKVTFLSSQILLSLESMLHNISIGCSFQSMHIRSLKAETIKIDFRQYMILTFLKIKLCLGEKKILEVLPFEKLYKSNTKSI